MAQQDRSQFAPDEDLHDDDGLEAASLTDGQRRRIQLLKNVEPGVCARIEQICTSTTIEVTDVAVLVVAAEAHAIVFSDQEPCVGTSVVVGHREKVREFLNAVLPPGETVAIDPYEDLLSPAPHQCVRVLIIDAESLTVLSYGTFVTVRIQGSDVPDA
jgi:hypothetical protein